VGEGGGGWQSSRILWYGFVYFRTNLGLIFKKYEKKVSNVRDGSRRLGGQFEIIYVNKLHK